MKNLKKMIALGLAAMTAVSAMSITAMAAVEEYSEVPSVMSSSEISPRINWQGTARLYTGSFSNITSSNNLFTDSPKITSDANNPGHCYIRVVNSSGTVIVGPKILPVGKTITLSSIPANSGTYTIQGQALSVSGVYTFNVD